MFNKDQSGCSALLVINLCNGLNGADVFTGRVINSWRAGVIEPLKIKTQAVGSAAEVAEMILRIDDIISGGKQPAPQMPPGGMPPGMGM